jgi:hypothetical protein
MLTRARRAAAAVAVAGALGMAAGVLPAAAESARPLLNDPDLPFTLEVTDVSARVGEATVLRATLRPRDGYRVLDAYNNRVSRLSTQDDGVTFPRKTVSGSVVDGGLVFAIPVQPTKPGRHAINGVFRVGYATGSNSMGMVTVPLMIGVTGTE